MINPMCNCRAATKTTIHYLLRCRLYSAQSVELLNGVYKLHSTLHNPSQDQLLTVLLYGSEKFAFNVNKEIIRQTISYLKAPEPFVLPLFFDQHLLFIFCLFIYYLFIPFIYSFVIPLCLIVQDLL